MKLAPADFHDSDFSVPSVRGRRVTSLIGYNCSADELQPVTLALTLDDRSVHRIFLDAWLCRWVELDAPEVPLLEDDFEGTPRCDYSKRFNLEGAIVRDVYCSREDGTRVVLDLDVGRFIYAEVDGTDPDTAARVSFSPR